MSSFAKKLTFAMFLFGVSAVTVSQAEAAGRCGRSLFRRTSTPSPAAAVASAEDGTVRRSFSYEPSYRSYGGYRSNSSKPAMERWQYPKADPRRYR
jgi:hypothetical protein